MRGQDNLHQPTHQPQVEHQPIYHIRVYMNHRMTKPTKRPMRPTKTQISLGIRPVWSESSLCTPVIAKDPKLLHADSEGSDQTVQMPRLIWVFAGPTDHIVVFVALRLTRTYYTRLSLQIWRVNSYYFTEIVIFIANRNDADQTLRSLTSNLALHS